MSVTSEKFGQTPDGKNVDIYTLTNDNGLSAQIINYGGIVKSLTAPDRNGKLIDVALGYDSLDGYIKGAFYFGTLIGRVGNRIAKGKFVLDRKEYTLAVNNGPNHLHGGIKGFDKVVWDARPLVIDEGPALELTYLSPDGEEGYPGSLSCKVIYTLTNNNELKIEYEATTDQTTVVNMTHHGYFNLAGHNAGDILSHEIMINADHFTPADEGSIPTGEIRPVDGTPMDFRISTAIGKQIESNDEQLKFGHGYDHNWVLNNKTGDLALAATFYEKKSGIAMDVLTTKPGMQFYSGNFLDGSNPGKGGAVYNRRNGLCAETQYFPDSPNKPDFPSCILQPGQIYKHITTYRFYNK
ncbi:MAG: galactose mutarotase [Sedimentisphaerales bacterium]|nr:galactose mutarotase [Sedimentisphaerales bacterium]